ncbi:hypothetical protein GGS23DRAFT_507516 [Durotheca rogersii]|uniref:uncharacterized protein n=1 Tax=Durotheca rogersii TaxID=419775 RepID=UPI00221FB82C|nr:uncharacterized protein GGS23DRAFT_507516 [Durotheca rogersii]KAI5863632.1 hypothetical protein GGS23DRAFT_507516 [Durotheca rogersii]
MTSIMSSLVRLLLPAVLGLVPSLFAPSASAVAVGGIAPRCKCLPTDPCWPSVKTWDAFNRTVGGRLIATVPLGSPCHDPTFDEEKCNFLREQWHDSAIHLESSSSVMAPIFANQSCDPWQQPRSTPCALGNYVSYAVEVSGAADIAATLRFARERNLRFVVRNTGHDYLGRSTGAGALAVWTRRLKSIEVVNWRDPPFYSGKAMRLGAGVLGYEALAAARAAGLVVLTGECPSVGVAGGYVQGGGHSALSTSFGLAADNTLSFDVVTPRGKLLTASRTKNSDLYWALSGGGGGAFGVVVAITVRAHPDTVVSGASFDINVPSSSCSSSPCEGENGKQNLLSEVIDTFHAALPAIVDAGAMVIYFFGDGFLRVPALTAYGKTREDVAQMLTPLGNALAALNVTLAPTLTQFDSYGDHYNHYWGPPPAGNIEVGTQLFGGRLIPRSELPSFGPASRKLVELGVVFIGVGLDVSRFGRGGRGKKGGGERVNAVLPQWRDTLVSASLTLAWGSQDPFEQGLAEQRRITDVIQPIIEAATPGSGAYINEADFRQPDWQDVFYGANYPALLRVKQKYDPDRLLYGAVTVGSEFWTVSEEGRMCRADGGRAPATDTDGDDQAAEMRVQLP